MTPPLPPALVKRLKNDGIDLARAKSLVSRAAQKAVRSGVRNRRPPSTGFLERDYQSMSFNDIGELLHALAGQHALGGSAHARLGDELAIARGQCTPAKRAAVMLRLQRALLGDLQPAYREFMRVAVKPLTNAHAIGLRSPRPLGVRITCR